MRARGEPRVKVVAVTAVLIALLVIPTISSSINIYATRIDTNNNSIADADTYNKEVIANKLLNTRISLPFIANVGQYDDSNIKYYADTFAGRVLIYDDDNNNNGIVYLLKSNVIKERLIITSTADNNNTTSTDSIILKGNDPSITKVNYFKANKVLTDIPTYNSISFVSNSIELILKAYNNNIEKVFVVKPYADVNDIVMEVDNNNNSSSISIDNDGRLIIINDDDNNNNNDGIAFTKPIAYQIIDGKKVNVDVSYRIIADNRYGFSVGNYDSRYDLIIDPLLDLSASTYIGGASDDAAWGIAIDSNNNVFIAGGTRSNNFPIVNGYDDSLNGNYYDAFVAKFNNDLNNLLASTYIGGDVEDYAVAIAIDSNNGNVFIAGGTYSNNFPIVNGYDDSFNGRVDAFVAKFNNDLNNLLASTYIGGNGYDFAEAIAIDSNNNNVFIAGRTWSNDFPIKDGYDDSYNGGDAFVAKFNNGLDNLLASTYIGGNDSDWAGAIAIDSNNGNVFIAGGTYSNNFPIVNGYDDSFNGYYDAFVAKFNNDLNNLLASTYIGGNVDDSAVAIAIDSNNGNVFIAGYTYSNNFPIVNGYDDSFNGYYDAFVAKLTSTEPIHNLELYEDGNPSDRVIDLGEDITAKATTIDSSIVNVTFRWIDPSNNEVRTNTVNIVNGEANDTYTPNQVGTWKVVAEFSNGAIVVKELQVPFQVVPESIIGALSVIGSSLVVLAVYRRRRKTSNN
jgi:hypothetical protein